MIYLLGIYFHSLLLSKAPEHLDDGQAPPTPPEPRSGR